MNRLIFVLLLISGFQSQSQSTSLFKTLNAAKTRPPAKLFVEDQTFDVGMLESQHMAGQDGMTFCAKHLILINVDAGEREMRSAFTHEMLHAITCKYGGSAKLYNSKSDKKHEGIYFLAPKLADVLEHNPRLILWMNGGGEGDTVTAR